MSDRYGDTTEIVASVLRELDDIEMPSRNTDLAIIQLIDLLEKGVQDLTAIGRRNDIASIYTVNIIEKKLPRNILSLWLIEVERSNNEERFEVMFEFLKKVRKRTEKLVQQAKEKEKEKERAREMSEKNNRDREERRRQGGSRI